jgi:hypothetical protein
LLSVANLFKLPESQKLQDSYTNTDKKQTQRERQTDRQTDRDREVRDLILGKVDMAIKGLMMHQKLTGTGMVVSRAILIYRVLGDAFRFSARFSELLYLCSEDWCNMPQLLIQVLQNPKCSKPHKPTLEKCACMRQA